MLKRAIRWIRDNALDTGWAPISHRLRKPYPEVTGYWIPTLIQAGEHNLAERFARYLITIQAEDGAFTLDQSGEKFVFDTGQIIRGLVALAPRMPELRQPLRKACDWIIAGADPQTGKFQVPAPGNMWSLHQRGEVSEGIHLYVIQPLRDAATILDAPHIRDAADRALHAYVTTLDVTNFELPNSLTHFYAYMQEALLETGHRDLAIAGMNSAAKYQLGNGAVPAYHDVAWICTPGLAQLAKVWHLLGQHDRAEAALGFLRNLQNHTGGFYGSYGPFAEYFPADEISWAAKYVIDAELLSIQHHFNATAYQYGQVISPHDGRAQAILSACEGAGTVLDVGCGKGRYAALLKTHWPAMELHGTDISAEMLAAVPAGIHTRLANFQCLPYEDEAFDVVYTIEALEHAPNPRGALAEMARLVRPGGRLVVIDKNVEKLGALQIERFESWFGRDEIAAIFDELGFDCAVSELSYDNQPANGLFLGWNGTKRKA